MCQNVDQQLISLMISNRITVLRKGSIAQSLYNGKKEVEERHRHRYEVNPLMVEALENGGLLFSGKDITGQRMEIIELNTEGNFMEITWCIVAFGRRLPFIFTSNRSSVLCWHPISP